MQTKNKVLIGGLSSLAVAAGVALTGGTSAYFYDLERSEGNRLSACSLDLVEENVVIDQEAFGDEDSSNSQLDATTTPGGGGLSIITIDKLVPGDVVRVDIHLKNEGNCAGELWGDVNFPITDNENGILEPESAVGDTTDGNLNNPSDAQSFAGGGELDTVLQAEYLGPDDDGVTFTGSYHELAYEYPYLLDSDFTAGEPNVVSVRLSVPDDGTATDGNEIMGDSFTFAVDFAAAQKNKINPRPRGVGKDLNNLSTLNNS